MLHNMHTHLGEAGKPAAHRLLGSKINSLNYWVELQFSLESLPVI